MADRADAFYSDAFYNDFLSPLAFRGLQLAQDLAKVGTPEAVALHAANLRASSMPLSRRARPGSNARKAGLRSPILRARVFWRCRLMAHASREND
jgi:hypothetical protein